MSTPESFRLAIIRNPFERHIRDERVIEFEDAPTIQTLVGEYLPAGTEFAASINGELIPVEAWTTYQIKPTDQLVIAPRVLKGAGRALASIAMIAVMVAAPWLGAWRRRRCLVRARPR